MKSNYTQKIWLFFPYSSQILKFQNHSCVRIIKLEKILNGNSAFERKLLGVFVDTVPCSIEKLRIACDQGDIETIAKTAHKLKTTIHTMSIDEFPTHIQQLKALANVKSNIAQMSLMVNEVPEVLDDFLQKFKERLTE